LDFLQQETIGYKVITLGSSAGGYAAVLYGSLLNANQVLAFNPQFELKSLLQRSCETIDPLLFRLKNEAVSIYYDIYDFINEEIDIYYFYSNKSVWDIEQYSHIKDLVKIHKIGFSTAHHGIPFLKIALSQIVNFEKNDLNKLSNKTYNSWLFSIKIVGLWSTILGFIIQSYRNFQNNMNLYKIKNV
jgi:hypothetical protein